MATINRFNQPAPAQDNYFNTFVPLPMDQLTALGMSRKQDLEKNQNLLDKAYNDVLNIQAIPGSKDETIIKTNITPAMNDIAMKYAALDLTDPQQLSNMRREIRSRIDPNLINRIEQSHAGWLKKQQGVDAMKQAGTYNQLLDEDPSNGWDSASQGAYNYMPESYHGKAAIFEPLLNNLKPNETIDWKNGMLVSKIDPADVDKIAVANAKDTAATPAGKQLIKEFTKMYPDVASGQYKNNPEQIMRHLINGYGADHLGGVNYTPIPESLVKAMNAGNQQPPATPERVSTAGNIHSWDNITDVKAEINDLKKAGNTQGALDLQYALEDAAKENNLDLSKYSDTKPLLGDPKFIQKIEDLTYGVPKDREAVKNTLQKVGYTISNKLSFGFPHYDSGSLSQSVNPTTGDKLGTFDFADLSNNMIAHPDLHEILDVNGKKLEGDKLKTAMQGAITKDLIDVSVGVTPKSQNDYKPEITFTYQDSAGKVTTVRSLINDPSSQRNTAKILTNRGDYSAAAAVMQPHLTNAVETTNFDSGKPVTFKLVRLDSNGSKTNEESPLVITRDTKNRSIFHIEYETANEGKVSDIAQGRQDLISKMYDLVAKNGVEFEK